MSFGDVRVVSFAGGDLVVEVKVEDRSENWVLRFEIAVVSLRNW